MATKIFRAAARCRWGCFLGGLVLASGLDNGLGRTPLLGFNSWNSAACAVNETYMRATMDAFVSLGLRDAGWTTVSVDDCWARSRDANGTLVADPVAFPSGMAALAAYAHARGLKFGLYSSNSPLTCAGRPGSFGFEAQDAATFAAWSVDLLKLDNCGDQNVIGPPERGYAVMRDALNATGRPIFFSACEWAVDTPAMWMPHVANAFRTTYDIQNDWACVTPHVDWTNVFADLAGPGAFTDMDILETGNGALTPAEDRAHYSLWVVMKSQLLIGCDLTGASADCLAALPLFLNPEVLAISQDPLGKPARRVAAAGDPGDPVGKSGLCNSEELPQNTVIAPCDAADPLQAWTMLPNGTLTLAATGECLQLDSGQSGCCSQDWSVWYNNAGSAMCNDPSSCCGARQQLWSLTASGTLVNDASGQCLTVMPTSGLRQVGVTPCALALGGLQTWTRVQGTGQLVSAAAPAGATTRYCLARTPDVRGGATEVWAGPLSNGDTVVLLFNRNAPAGTVITALWSDLGLQPGATMNVRDLWARTSNGTATGSVSAPVDAHGVVLMRLSAA